VAEELKDEEVPGHPAGKGRESDAFPAETPAVPGAAQADPGGTVALPEVTLAIPDAAIPRPDETLAGPDAGPSPTGGEEDQAKGLPEWKCGDTILETYTVKEIYEGGGFGRVYRVRHGGWNRDIALKSLRRNLAHSGPMREGFIRECQGWVAMGLHPHVVSCYYVRDIEGSLCIFSEFMEGGSLEERLEKKGSLELSEALFLGLQCLDGLSSAHRQGIIHQDIKPGNCLLTGTGTLKITDFGIALGLTSFADAPGMAVKGKKTQRTMIFQGGRAGTPAYMPPEQWSASHGIIGPWSDLYSFGIMLYGMCTGENPFSEGYEEPEVLKVRHLSVTPPDPRELNQDIPARLARFLLKCLEKNYARRFQKCSETFLELASVYREVTGAEYRKVPFDEMAFRPGELSNRAISLVDLGRPADAIPLLDQALSLDAYHIESAYNRCLLRWRSATMTDEMAVRELEEVCAKHPHEWHDNYFCALLHLERMDGAEALKALDGIPPADAEREEIRALRARAEEVGTALIEHPVSLAGHTKGVLASAMSADGARGISGSIDATIRVWNLDSGECVGILRGHGAGVQSVALSADGLWALSGSSDATMRLWDLETMTCARVLERLNVTAHYMAMTPDGRRAASGSRGSDRMVHVWDLAAGRSIAAFPGPESFTSLAISPDGTLVAAGCGLKKTVTLWNAVTGEMVGAFNRYDHVFFLLPDCRRMLVRDALQQGTEVRQMSLVDRATGKRLRSFSRFQKAGFSSREEISHAILSGDEGYILSGDSAGTLKLWEVSTERCLRTIATGASRFSALSYSPTSGKVFSTHHPLTTVPLEPRLWSLRVPIGPSKPFRAPYALAVPEEPREEAAGTDLFMEVFGRAGEAYRQGLHGKAFERLREARALRGHEYDEKAMQLWIAMGSQAIRRGVRGSRLAGEMGLPKRLRLDPKKFDKVALARSGRFLAGAKYMDGEFCLWDTSTGNCAVSSRADASLVSLALSSTGKRVFGGCYRGKIICWETGSGGPPLVIAGHDSVVSGLALGADDRWLLSGGSDGAMKLWDTDTGVFLRLFPAGGMVDAVALSPESSLALSADIFRTTIKVWDTATGKCLQTFEGGGVPVAFSPDGCHFFSGSTHSRHVITLRNVGDGAVEHTFEGHTDRITSIVPLADGRWLLSGSLDGTIRIWEIATGECAHVIRSHSREWCSLALSRDGRSLYEAGGALWRWEIDWDYEPHEPSDWDDGALPYLRNFIALHASRGAAPVESAAGARARQGMPSWDEGDFNDFLGLLGDAGFGWLRADGVRRKLEELLHLPAPPTLELSSLSPRALTAAPSVTLPVSGAAVSAMAEESMVKKGLRGARLAREMPAHHPWSPASRFTGGGESIFLASFHQGLIARFDVATGDQRGLITGTPLPFSFSLSSDASWLLCQGQDGRLRLWETEKGRCVMVHDAISRLNWPMALLSADGAAAFVSTYEGAVMMIELASGAILRRFEGHTRECQRLTLNANCTEAMTLDATGVLNLWNVDRKKPLYTTRVSNEPAEKWRCAVSATMKRLAFTSMLQGEIDIRALGKKEAFCRMKRSGNPGTLHLSADGRYLFAGGVSDLELWEVDTGRLLWTFQNAGFVDARHDLRYLLLSDTKRGPFALSLWELDWNYGPGEPREWHTDMEPYLESFIICHTPPLSPLPGDRPIQEGDVEGALARQGEARWNDGDLQVLQNMLASHGYPGVPGGVIREKLQLIASRGYRRLPVLDRLAARAR